MNKPSNISWKDYIGSMADKNFDPALLDVEGIDSILNFTTHFHHFFSHSIPAIYLLDYTTGKYVMMTNTCKSIVGYNSDYFKDGGVFFSMESYQKEFFKVYSERVFSDRIKLVKDIPPAEHPRYIFSHNFKFRSKKGELKRLIQRSCFIKSNQDGSPLLALGMVINTEHFQKDNAITDIVEILSPKDDAPTEIVQKHIYFLNEEEKLFTKREKEVLLWIAEGLTSKQIAAKMYVSEHTVINHRRNMMEKTNSQRVSDLLVFAIKNGII